MNKNIGAEFITPTAEEDAVLDRVIGGARCGMTKSEQSFLNALVLRNKPKKALEIGTADGGSAIVILNAMREYGGATLCSVDLVEKNLANHKNTGWNLDNYPELKQNCKLFNGGLALNFIEEIAGEGGIDFCLIDTAHINPGEILDFLMVLPFLKDDAVVVFHDVALQTVVDPRIKDRRITNCLLMSAINGQKILNGGFKEGETLSNLLITFPNIAAVKIGKETRENIWEIFNLLILDWVYIPNEKQEQEIISHFEKYYDKYYIDYLKKVFQHQKGLFARTQKERQILEQQLRKAAELPLKRDIEEIIQKSVKAAVEAARIAGYIKLPKWAGKIIWLFIWKSENRKTFRKHHVRK